MKRKWKRCAMAKYQGKYVDRNEYLKYAYRSIKNATGDTQLAKRAQQWSPDRIKGELGIIVRKTELKPIKNVSRKKRELTSYQYAKEQGFTTEEAIKLKRYSKRFIERERAAIVSKPKQRTRFGLPIWDSIALRKREWRKLVKKFAKLKKEGKSKYDHPVEIVASNINTSTSSRQGALDINNRYGYAVVYYAYIHNRPLSDIKPVIRIDDQLNDIYIIQQKITTI